MDMSKREVPTSVKKILDIDVYLTSQFVKFMEKFLVLRQLRTHYKLLEISCHGLLWLPCWIAFIWVVNKKEWYQIQINFLLGLIMDIIVVAILKAYTRRRRPAENSDPFGFGPDKYSFPSGHASRCLFITSFFIYVWRVHFIFIPPLLCWSVSLCISRVLMKRHHLLDIAAGAILGILEAAFIGLIYLDYEICTNFIWWLTDEKLDGGEYHV